MSGTTAATFDGFSIVQNGSAKEGGIYFKKDGIGGNFLNGTVQIMLMMLMVLSTLLVLMDLLILLT